MNANETTAIRELTAQEVDEVNGGILGLIAAGIWLFAFGVGLGGGMAEDYAQLSDGYTGT